MKGMGDTMKKYAILQYLSAALAVLLSDIMCAAVAYNYCSLQWSARYEGASAPPSIAYLFAIPYLLGIILCTGSSWFFRKKAKKEIIPR